MDRQEAIEYLQEKEIIRDDIVKRPKFNKTEQKEIRKVVREGKIYGDPFVELKE